MKSISIKLWGLMLALVFIALALIWCFQIVFLESFYFNIHERKLLTEGNHLVAMIKNNEEKYIIEEKLDELLLKYNARIDLYTPNGVEIYSSEAAPKMMGVDKNIFLMEVIKSKKPVSTFKENRMGSSLFLVGLPVIRDNVMTAAVIMTTPVASLEETVDTLKEQFVIISLILISVSAILAYVFSRYFTKPILEINKAAKTMAEGNLSIRVPVSTKDELGMLSSTINHLSSQLQKIEQLRKDLIANVSHEFKTPLSLIKGYAETMRDVENISEEKRYKQLNIIIEESDKLNHMINEILDLSQIQSDYYNLNRTDFSISDTIRAVVNRLAYHTENKNLRIEVDCMDALLIYADEKRIEQVIYNLLNNAINHSEQQSSIFIRAIDHGSVIVVEIEDHGEGISQEEIPYIWDRFYKAKEASAKHKGSGLGLAIVKSILEAHKANFGVESEIGKGSKFWFEIRKSA
ncbi:MAG: signal transduction histidine kinase [Clostridia bacterium]|jgi:signal transduction histidine kinase|nr:signal transduction histidine kinase [Clostridia bacterium]